MECRTNNGGRLYARFLDDAKIQAMYRSYLLLTALERRHGPLHEAIVAMLDQWRWKRQLNAIIANPDRVRFSRLRVIFERIQDIRPESTSPQRIAQLRKLWQTASDRLTTVLDQDERIWTANNRLSA